jgi:EAL domain-containing protein (putative c-di-GMP-specific phosphodiesterase class I)
MLLVFLGGTMGLARHLMSVFSLFLFVLLLISACTIVLLARYQVQQQSLEQTQFLANMIVSQVQHSIENDPSADIASLMNSTASKGPIKLLSLTDVSNDQLIHQYYQRSIQSLGVLDSVKFLNLISPPIKKSFTNSSGSKLVLTIQLHNVSLLQFTGQVMIGLFIGYVVLTMCLSLYIRRFSRSITQSLSAIESQSHAVTNKHFPVLKPVKSVKEVEQLVQVHNDMTEQVKTFINELSERLEHAKKSLYKDELTQLGNRRLFIAQLSQALHEAEAHNGALVFIRLNQFELIRQQEGFNIARSLLEDIIHVSQLTLQQDGNLELYRVNEYEFASILKDVLQDDVIDRIHQLSAEFTELQNRYQRKKQVLIGATVFQAKETISDVLIRVDDALNMASKEPHLFHFNSENSELSKVSSLLKSRAAVLNVIEEANLSFCQQRVVLADEINNMFAEVLSSFEYQNQPIPARLLQAQAEKFHCVEYFDKRIIEMVKQAYLNSELILPVSINLSPYSMLDEKFNGWLTELSHSYGDFFSSVIWEFDEASLSQIQHATLIVHRLQSMGSKVAVDHFGIGDNTLKMLRMWHVDVIKIDGSFIHDLDADQANWSFLETIVQLAHSLGITVVCEQIETDKEARWARQLGMDGLQGFQIAHPMTNFNLKN